MAGGDRKTKGPGHFLQNAAMTARTMVSYALQACRYDEDDDDDDDDDDDANDAPI
ncbi:hypothetical protein SAMD00023353_3100090 [Rosellinia necatrix]|uniref:Uncharacterized protein n=1 Tax=Rosellinia necatrix TaxID=77044 RepID=A0A1S8A8N4_ROSNE|nr:hypothetical protein SAMD00023353_3100090 [Rosellinia necatrix]